MNVISDQGVFALLLLFGAFAVAVHAYDLYGKSLEPSSARESTLLDDMPLVNLVGTRAYNRGFLCYLGITEFLFIVLSFSSVILELWISVSGSQDSVGALQLGTEEFNPLTPLVASTAIMTFGRFRPFAQVEGAIRRISHRVAGIPNDMYGRLDRIRTFDFGPRAGERPTPSRQRAAELAALAGAGARDAELEPADTARLERDVRCIYTLRAWTFGADGDGVWDERIRAELHRALTLARSEFALFDEALRAALPVDVSSDPVAGLDAWRALAAEARRTRANLATLFSLLAINQPDPRALADGELLDELLRDVRRRDETREVNALLGAAIGGLAIGLLLVTIYYVFERPAGERIAEVFAESSGDSDAEGATAEAEAAVNGAGENGAGAEASEPTAEAEAVAAANDAGENGAGAATEALPAWTRLPGALRRAIDSTVPLGIIFVVSALSALGIRAAREAGLEWTRWSREGLPVRQYLSVALMATLLAFLFYTLYSFHKLVVAPSLMLDGVLISPSLLGDFASHYADFMLVPLIGAVCAVAVCLVADRQPTRGHGADSDADRAAPRQGTVRTALFAAACCGLVGALVRVHSASLDPYRQIDLRTVAEALFAPMLILGPCFMLFGWLYGKVGSRRASGVGPPETVPARSPTAGPRAGTATATASRVAASTVPVLLVALAILFAADLRAEPDGASDDEGASSDTEVIRVGVRDDAKPFSYQGKTEGGETILVNYRGYMVEVCRRVLHTMVRSGPFAGHRVEAVKVAAGERFDKLAEGELDLLCGPDSITSTRLRRYSVSHPMFVSGMTYAYVDPDSGRFPRGPYCGNVVGVVGGTTAETVGLRMMAAEGVLLRFDPALEVYLAQSPRLEEAKLDERRRLNKEILLDENAARTHSDVPEDKRNVYYDLFRQGMAKVQKDLWSSFVTEECPNGATTGLPVRIYNNHDEGISDLCEQRVLYYIGDYDIIRRKIEAKGDCPVVIERFTRTKEVYGAFFRAGFLTVGKACPECAARDALLYAVFNHTLLRMMQSNIDILAVEFEREFGGDAKSAELDAFFETFRIASDY